MTSLFEPPREEPPRQDPRRARRRSIPRLDHVLLVVGAATMIGAARMTWMRGQTRMSGHVDWTGIDDTGEGGMLLVCGLIVLALVRWRGTLEGIEPRARYLPAIIAFAAACLWVISFRKLVSLSFDTPGGAQPDLGVYVAGIGVLVMVAGALLAARRWADPLAPPHRRSAAPRAPSPVQLPPGSDGYATRARVERRDPPRDG